MTFVYLYSMKLFSANPTIFSKEFQINFLPMKTLKKGLKIAHNQLKPLFFHSPAQPTAHSPDLIFHNIYMSQDSSVSVFVVQIGHCVAV